MAESKLNKPIGNSLLWEDFIKNHPILPSFSGFGEFLEWSLKNNVPNPYKLWGAKKDFESAEELLRKSKPTEEDKEDKEEKKEKKSEKHEEHDAPEPEEDKEDKEEKKEKKPKQTQQKKPTSTNKNPKQSSVNDEKNIAPNPNTNFEKSEPLPPLSSNQENIVQTSENQPTNEPLENSETVINPTQLAPEINESSPSNEPQEIISQNYQNAPSEFMEIQQTPQEQPRIQETQITETSRSINPLPSYSIPIRPLRAKKAIRTTRVITTAAKASRIPGVGWILLIALGLLIFGLIAIVVVISFTCFFTNNPIGDILNVNACRTTEAQQPNEIITPTPPPPGGNPTAECNTNPRQCLKNEFNFDVIGNASQAQMNDVFNLLSEVTVSPEYKRLLRTSGPTQIEFISDASRGGGCPARVQPIGGGRSKLTLYNYSLSSCSRTSRKSRLVHESGHVLRNGHMRLFDKFEQQAYNKDSGCYYRDMDFSPSFFINTYSTGFGASQGVSLSGSNESMADLMALYVIPEGRYPAKCPVGYNWIKQNIFGNYIF